MTVVFGLCSFLLTLNVLVTLMRIPWFIMFWTLFIVIITSVQPCKLVQAINLKFKINEAKTRRYWCIRSRILTENGNIAPLCWASSDVIAHWHWIHYYLLRRRGRRKGRKGSFPGSPCASMSKRISHEGIHYDALSKCHDYEWTNAREDQGDTASGDWKKRLRLSSHRPRVLQLSVHCHHETCMFHNKVI